jgi:hypothetical protein
MSFSGLFTGRWYHLEYERGAPVMRCTRIRLDKCELLTYILARATSLLLSTGSTPAHGGDTATRWRYCAS